jgi:hypothetical protein
VAILIKTRFPHRFLGRTDLPSTAWLGVTIQKQADVGPAEEIFGQLQNIPVRWLYLELLEDLHFSDLTMFSWLVAAATAGAPPQFAWVARLYGQAKEAGCAVFLMPVLMGNTGRQRPGMVLPQEVPEGVEVPQKA